MECLLLDQLVGDNQPHPLDRLVSTLWLHRVKSSWMQKKQNMCILSHSSAAADVCNPFTCAQMAYWQGITIHTGNFESLFNGIAFGQLF